MTTAVMTKQKDTSKQGGLHGDITAVLRLIEDFGKLLTEETGALKKADFSHVDMLQNDKKNYAKQYHALVTALSQRKEEFAKVDIGTREKLIRARTNLTITLNDNMRALEMAKESTRRLVDRILDTARKSVVDDQQTNYSSKGKAQAYKTATLSLSVDRSL